MSHIILTPHRTYAQHWVSWNGSDAIAGAFGWAVTLGYIAHQWGPVLDTAPQWSAGLVIELGAKLIPVAVLVVLLALLGLELGIPLWAPWRLFRARRTLAIQHNPPALIHGTGFWPVYFHRTYPRDIITRVVLEVESAEQHLKNERYADFARLALFRPGARLPKVLLHKTRCADELLPLYHEIGEFLAKFPADSAPPSDDGARFRVRSPRRPLTTLDEAEA